MYPYQTPPPPKRDNFFVTLLKQGASTVVIAGTAMVTLGVAFIVLVIVLVAGVAGVGGSGPVSTSRLESADLTLLDGDADSDHTLLRVDVTGVILGDDDGSSGGFLGEAATFGYEVKRILEEAADDDDIDGVLLYMSTPGGTIYGSRAIADGVARYRDVSSKPIVAFVEGLSASGGMYAMAGADHIIADHGSAIGSIGVIFGPFEFYDKVTEIDGGLLAGGIVTQNGIEQTYFTAGAGKDFGNPFRRLTPKEIEVAQRSVNDSYGDFVAEVAKAREIPAADIIERIGAYIYGNAQAQELKLIDETASLDAAYDDLAKRANLSAGDWKVLGLSQAGGLGLLFGTTQKPQPAGEGSGAQPLACRLVQRQALAYHDIGTFCGW